MNLANVRKLLSFTYLSVFLSHFGLWISLPTKRISNISLMDSSCIGIFDGIRRIKSEVLIYETTINWNEVR